MTSEVEAGGPEPTSDLPPEPVAPDVAVVPHFGAGAAFLTFVLVIGAQFGVSVAMAVLLTIVASVPGAAPTASAALDLNLRLLPVTVFLAEIAAAGALLMVARGRARHLVRERTPLGLTLPATHEIVAWACVGLVLALAYLVVAGWLVPMKPDTPHGPLVTMALSGGWALASWAIFALLFAPPIEEFLFRGLMLRGFAESWGGTTAALMVSLLFVIMHLPETLHYWPATVVISALALVTLAARLLSGSIVASMAVHFAYNAVMVVIAFVASLRSS
jgi:membrane protease YdiL (CAAX protease family)